VRVGGACAVVVLSRVARRGRNGRPIDHTWRDAGDDAGVRLHRARCGYPAVSHGSSGLPVRRGYGRARGTRGICSHQGLARLRRRGHRRDADLPRIPGRRTGTPGFLARRDGNRRCLRPIRRHLGPQLARTRFGGGCVLRRERGRHRRALYGADRIQGSG
jgi:hypothetical protein